MKSIIKLSTNANDCKLREITNVSMATDTQNTPQYWGIVINDNICVEGYPTKEDALNDIDNVVNYYNSDMWNDIILADMYWRYIYHVKKYNKYGCMDRADFATDSEYSAYISGLCVQLKCSIETHLKSKFTDEYELAPMPDSINN